MTFEDLESYFETQGYSFRGDAAIFTRHSKLALWTGWNRKTLRLVMELVAEGKLELFNPGLANAPAPPAFRGITGLSQANFLPVVIQAKGGERKLRKPQDQTRGRLERAAEAGSQMALAATGGKAAEQMSGIPGKNPIQKI